MFFLKKNIAIKRKFLTTVKERYFLLSGYRNLFSKKLTLINFIKMMKKC